MGPSYGYYGTFLADNLYVILLIPIFALSLWAQYQVSSQFKKYSAVRNLRGLTGAQAAEAVLRANGVHGVGISGCSGSLTDHYDPRSNMIYLSESVLSSATVAAVGVAAHEAGHAVQYAKSYAPIRLRAAIIPATQFGSKFAFILLMIGLMLYLQPVFAIGIVLFSFTTIFQLLTLPVEFDASHRALVTLETSGLLRDEELDGARKVLRAAALTYVAAMLMSVLQLLRYVLLFLGRSNRRGGRR